MVAVFHRGARAGRSLADRRPRQLWAFPVSTLGLDRLFRNRRGNVAMMYALVAPVLVFGGGAAIDYGRAAQIRTKLNAAADAAALSALTPSMLQQSASVAQTAADNMFTGLTNGIPGLTPDATQVTVSVTVGATPLTRNVEVSYSTSVNTIFAQVLGVGDAADLGLLGRERRRRRPISTSTSCSTIRRRWRCRRRRPASRKCRTSRRTKQDGGNGVAPSPAIRPAPTTADSEGNPCADGTSPTLNSAAAVDTDGQPLLRTTKHGAQLDNYALARKNNITLRLDELNSGVSTLLQTASTTSQSTVFATPPKYQFSIYSMDCLWQIGLTQLMALTSNYTSGWTSASANFGVMEMYSNNSDCANSACSSSTTTPGGDVATNYDDSLEQAQPDELLASPTPATAPTSPATRRKKCCSSSPTASRTNRAAAIRLEQTMNDLAGDPNGPLQQLAGNQLVHGDQESRHQDRDPLYRLSRGDRQQPGTTSHIEPFQPEIALGPAGLRLARPVL